MNETKIMLPPQEAYLVVRLRGMETGTVLQLIEENGINEGFDYLKSWDRGEATRNKAIASGRILNPLEDHGLGQVHTQGEYTIAIDKSVPEIILMRRTNDHLNNPQPGQQPQ